MCPMPDKWVVAGHISDRVRGCVALSECHGVTRVTHLLSVWVRRFMCS